VSERVSFIVNNVAASTWKVRWWLLRYHIKRNKNKIITDKPRQCCQNNCTRDNVYGSLVFCPWNFETVDEGSELWTLCSTKPTIRFFGGPGLTWSDSEKVAGWIKPENTRRSRHSQECKSPRRQCFRALWPYVTTVRIYIELFCIKQQVSTTMVILLIQYNSKTFMCTWHVLEVKT